MTDIPPMTRRLTYTLPTSGVHKKELVNPETVSKNKVSVSTQNVAEENNNGKINVEKDEVKC